MSPRHNEINPTSNKRPLWKRLVNHVHNKHRDPPSDGANSKGTAKTNSTADSGTTTRTASSASPPQHVETAHTVNNGDILLRGSFAQDFCEHGARADPTICLLAAQQFLIRLPSHLRSAPAGLVDTLIERGVYFHHRFGHCTLTRILRQGEQAYAAITRQFVVQRPLSAHPASLGAALQHVAASNGRDFAVFVTAPGPRPHVPGPTYLAVHRRGDEDDGCRWWLFDSHGKTLDDDGMKCAYVQTCADAAAVADALRSLTSPFSSSYSGSHDDDDGGVLARLSPADARPPLTLVPVTVAAPSHRD